MVIQPWYGTQNVMLSGNSTQRHTGIGDEKDDKTMAQEHQVYAQRQQYPEAYRHGQKKTAA
jgi:hypothetical protein